jgi:catechol 2,3-dioxygenase-like lactoylglutathione lyase family enzyme
MVFSIFLPHSRASAADRRGFDFQMRRTAGQSAAKVSILVLRRTKASRQAIIGSVTAMRIKVTSVMVDDQDKALKFYTEILGFVKKTDIPAGKFRWLTLVSPEDLHGIELLIEPNDFPPARVFQRALFDAGIPLISFAVEDIQKEYRRMRELGVAFRTKPTQIGPATVALFDDTCGNLIQLAQT